MPRRRTSILRGAGLAALLLGSQGSLPAAEPKPIEASVAKALAKEVIGPRQTQAEVADYCETAIPAMPRLTTVADWEAYAREVRSKVFDQVIFRGEAERWRDAKGRVEWFETLKGGPGYRIKRLRYEALPGLWIPALLYEPEKLEGKVPVVLDVNGHEKVGKSADYKQAICINQAKRGMLALNIEWFEMGQLTGGYRHDLINHIDLTGTSGIAAHYLAMTRGIDVLLAHEHADPTRVAVTGLSGGGWQTIFVSAFDTRVTLADPVAGYSSFRTRARVLSDLGDSEQTPCDLATVTDYATMTAMLAPRAALLTFNATDNCCFAAGHALPPLLEAAKPVYQLYNKADRLRSHVNTDPGTHNYLVDNRQAFYRMAGDQFYKGDSSYDPKEIPSDSELKSAEELSVPLPKDNATFHSLALSLSEKTPAIANLPKDDDGAQAWGDSHRAKLRDLVRFKSYKVQVVSKSEAEEAGIRTTHWRLKVGEWSVPAVEFVKGKPEGATVILGDSGRKGLSKEIASRLEKAEAARFVAIDPFYLGEASVNDHGYLYALLLSAVGDRPLGLQASEVIAVAGWIKEARGLNSIDIEAFGPRTSLIALVAGALGVDEIAKVTLTDSLGSLREPIESNMVYNDAPEIFCFGLLRQFDIPTLAALVAPRPVTFEHQSDRLKTTIKDLAAWYAHWDSKSKP
ncbi:alpha/beta hydrolase family protein [Singulisphaera sp. PoT]|uniref:alpha/beta hydrolase family protein n=1 Tax=Singulisphaera sp. PoT TaxID=3411797 RepID=UPI003BF48717